MPAHASEPDRNLGCGRVAVNIGQGLLDDAEDGSLQKGWQRIDPAADSELGLHGCAFCETFQVPVRGLAQAIGIEACISARQDWRK